MASDAALVAGADDAGADVAGLLVAVVAGALVAGVRSTGRPLEEPAEVLSSLAHAASSAPAAATLSPIRPSCRSASRLVIRVAAHSRATSSAR